MTQVTGGEKKRWPDASSRLMVEAASLIGSNSAVALPATSRWRRSYRPRVSYLHPFPLPRVLGWVSRLPPACTTQARRADGRSPPASQARTAASTGQRHFVDGWATTRRYGFRVLGRTARACLIAMAGSIPSSMRVARRSYRPVPAHRGSGRPLRNSVRLLSPATPIDGQSRRWESIHRQSVGETMPSLCGAPLPLDASPAIRPVAFPPPM